MNYSDNLRKILSETNLSNVTSESNEGFAKIPDGSYLCEVQKAELGESKATGNAQVGFRLQIIGNGVSTGETDKLGNPTSTIISGFEGKTVGKYYPLTDSSKVQHFVSDRLKFEDENGTPVLQAQYFTSPETIEDAINCLVGRYIWVNLSTSTFKGRDGEEHTSQWTRLLSWKRVKDLGLEDLVKGK